MRGKKSKSGRLASFLLGGGYKRTPTTESRRNARKEKASPDDLQGFCMDRSGIAVRRLHPPYFSFAPRGLGVFFPLTHSLRCGLHSFAAPRLENPGCG